MDQITTSISPFVIDIVLAVIILLVACIKAKAGLYQSVMSVVIIVVSLAIGLVGSKLLTPAVKDYAWKKYSVTIEKNFDEEVEAAKKDESSLSKSFRDSWNRVIGSFGSEKATEALEIQEQILDYNDDETVAKVKALTMLKAELTTQRACQVGTFGVLVAVSLLVLTLIKDIIGKLFELKLVSWANHLGGFILGAVEAIVILIVLIRGMGLLNIQFVNQLSEGTVLLNWFIGGDIQQTIQSLQSITVDDLKNVKLEDLTTVDFNDVGNQVKELMNNIDMSKAPDGVQDVINQVDVNQVTDETKGIVDSVKDLVNSIDTDKIKDGVKDVVDNKVKDTVKDVVDNTVKDVVTDIVK